MDMFAHRLREARKSRKLTQAQFAQAIGASQGSVSKWEGGKEKPGVDVMEKISHVTGLSFSYFFWAENAKEDDLVGWSIYPNIVGSIEGVFKDKMLWEDSRTFDFMIPLPPKAHSQFHEHLNGFIVLGDRANKKYHHGDFVFVVERQALEPENGDTVLILRTHENGQVELSLRTQTGSGVTWYMPLTDDPEYQEPVSHSSPGEGSKSLMWIGTVISSYRLEPRMQSWVMAEPYSD